MTDMITPFQRIKADTEKYDRYKDSVKKSVLKKYNEDPEYRARQILNNKLLRDKKREEHYNKWINDPEYAQECIDKGMRFRIKKTVENKIEV
jgi:hypothetical protein